MGTYIRQLSIADWKQCVAVESAAFPPAEAATPEKIEYRLTVCPEICMGLFSRTGSADTPSVNQEEAISVLASNPAGPDSDTLLAHVISTKSTTATVSDENMAFPPNWKDEPTAKYDVGHIPEGRTITLHSLAVSPAHQRSGFGKALMKSYIEQMKKTGLVDSIAILTYKRLVPYYQSLGFKHYGKSQAKYAGVAWHDLAYEFAPKT